VQQTVDAVSYVTETPRSRVNQLARRFIDDGVWPKSVGRRIEQIPGGEAVRLVAAVAFADRVAEASRIGALFCQLPLIAREDGDNTPFVLQEFLSVWFSGRPDNEIEGSLTLEMTQKGWASATFEGIASEDGQPKAKIEFHFADHRSWGAFSRRAFVISREGMEILFNLLARNETQD